MSNVKEHFEEKSKTYDKTVFDVILKYEEVITALINAIPFRADDKFTVLDLGCGTGNISSRIKDKYPKASITCLDIAENMIEKTKKKLADYGDIDFVVADFLSYDYPLEEYDVVVSSLAIHHLSDEGKKELYAKVYSCLRAGGVFYNADPVLGSNADLTSLNHGVWVSWLESKMSQEEVDAVVDRVNRQDIPAGLMDQLSWFSDCGFVDVDVVWKYYGYAVFGGKKIK